ncbi:MAG: hypothetical protein ACE5FH_10090 [Candidatus Zixiibacteriota bacterium]
MKSSAFVLHCVIYSYLTLAGSVSAEGPTSDTTATNHDALDVYVDCRDCPSGYYDYLKTELTFVNFVRDRKQSDVHVLVSTQSTGGGGDEITMEFIGRNEFSAMVDTLKFFTVDSDTDDTIRKRLAARLRLGLVRYLARTRQADDPTVTYSGGTDAVQASEKSDPWNYWASIGFSYSFGSIYNNVVNARFGG